MMRSKGASLVDSPTELTVAQRADTELLLYYSRLTTAITTRSPHVPRSLHWPNRRVPRLLQ